jgi:hypothetical protein
VNSRVMGLSPSSSSPTPPL